MKTYDFIAIGGGSAGFNAARVAHSQGRKVAIVDNARELGGLCILRGCMPSKTLLWPAEILHLAQKGRQFGLSIPKADVDLPKLQQRKRRIIAEFAGYREQQMTSGRYDLYRSGARFLDAHTIKLEDGTILRGRSFIIGTGSKPSVPSVPGLAETPFWTSDDILNLSRVPDSVLVLGGGIVACELVQYLNRIGSRVIQVQRSPQLLREHSPEAAAVVAQAFRDEGIELHTGTAIESVSADEAGKGIAVTFIDRATGKRRRRTADHLFNALGREPNTDGLNLAAAGVRTAPTGRIKVNRWQQTSQPHIYAGGDVCGPHDIVHLAVAQGELAARHACGMTELKPIDASLLLGVVFTDPQVASIGLGEAALTEKGVPHLSAVYPFNDHGKSILMDANYGYVRVFADKSRGRILGAEIVGPQAGELIHCFSTPLAMRATVFDMLRAPWYHPTLAEIITYPLEEIADAIP